MGGYVKGEKRWKTWNGLQKGQKKAAPTIARATLEERNEALLLLAEALQTKREYLLDENQQDITEAKQKRNSPTSHRSSITNGGTNCRYGGGNATACCVTRPN